MTEIRSVNNTESKPAVDTSQKAVQQTEAKKQPEQEQESIFVPTEKLVEDVAKCIARNPDGSLDMKTAREFTVMDLLDGVIVALNGNEIVDTPKDRELIEKQYKAFEALLQRRQEEESKKYFETERADSKAKK
ncbi:MAG: hypothetical protein K6A44_06510 [bacterium]|nr:hypothetical protein [bacterium]